MISRWGMPTLIEFRTIKDNVKLCHELGLSFVELNMNLPECQPEVIDLNKLINLKDDYDIDYTIHLLELLDVTQFNDGLRLAHIDLVLKTIEMAKKIGASILNMHMTLGIHFKLPDRKVYLYNSYRELYLSYFKNFVDLISSSLKGSDITINIENTGIYNVEFIQEAIELLIQCPYIKLTWDVGHDYAAKKVDWPLIHKYTNQVSHIHLHDATDTRNHLILYEGDLDIDSCIEFGSKHHCSCVIETKTINGLKVSVQRLVEKNHIHNVI